MLLVGDESKHYPLKVYGFTCIPINIASMFEAKAFEIRLKYNLFSNIDWKSIPSIENSKFEGYCEIIKVFLEISETKFCAIVFDQPSRKDLYNLGYEKQSVIELEKSLFGRMSFELLREISTKLHKVGNNDPLYILGDQSSETDSEWQLTRDFLEKSSRVYQTVESCTFGKSNICNLLQVADLIVGAICKRFNKISLGLNHSNLINLIEQISGINLDTEMPRLNWNESKIHLWRFRPKYRMNPSPYSQNFSK